MQDIEAKAPLLAQQRVEYEKMSDLCNNLQEQLQSAEQERLKLENARDAATRELTYTRAELERYQRDVEDLSRQVILNLFCNIFRQDLSNFHFPRYLNDMGTYASR